MFEWFVEVYSDYTSACSDNYNKYAQQLLLLLLVLRLHKESKYLTEANK
jgi:hypothetical protein